MHLSDLDDVDEEDCDKLDSDCEKVAGDEQDLQRAMGVSGSPHKRNCSSELHLSLSNSFHTFPCPIKCTLPPLPSDFPDPVVSKSSPSTMETLSHFESPDKPRIWSLARTAASGVILSPQQQGSELRMGGNSACQLQSPRLPVSLAGQCAGIRGLPETTNVSSPENTFSENSTLHSKVYGTGSYSHKGIHLHCSSYTALTDAYQYSSMIEGKHVSLLPLCGFLVKCISFFFSKLPLNI